MCLRSCVRACVQTSTPQPCRARARLRVLGPGAQRSDQDGSPGHSACFRLKPQPKVLQPKPQRKEVIKRKHNFLIS